MTVALSKGRIMSNSSISNCCAFICVGMVVAVLLVIHFTGVRTFADLPGFN